MIPIQQLPQRIRWDPEVGHAEFVIGYHYRVRGCIVKVALRDVQLETGDQFSFSAVEADGAVHDVPLHRIREVCRNDELTWQRLAPTRSPSGR
jgi:uncharacterized protein (UPF0248 family)